ncbi:uncharacterized protein GGS22DRAFT_142111 [Annulohypoxylon maeteangense]|uniref:uncharacterized protein n=1 Tax=Annulohypoxylon maeteangense TaxID=1927788 RepID=UPI0020085649|nr:uncharacterized protein GGS22DRAFT_142111 [Annulohypoxylon maeteangense]KAI0885307.1 hypothetical protein GGS22DRAFT_142111 [Annulohypoxylon maeteangense]
MADFHSSFGTATGSDIPGRSEQTERRPKPNTSPNANESKKHTRMCWICHDDVEPTYEETGFLDGIRNRRPKRTYISEDGDRLINPCRCKGSVKYVHEGCLKLWMNENPNAWKCGRCHYQYRMERMTWAQRIRSPIVALTLTMLILVITIFLLGFIADPILNLWIDPVGTIAESVTSGHVGLEDDVDVLGDSGWFIHFLKGLFSLGLLGFVKAFLVMSPWQWWNLRTSGIIGGGGRRAGTGRDRMENINLVLVIIGVITFLYTVWKATRKWTEKTLDRASQRILNVQGDNNDDDDSDDEDD